MNATKTTIKHVTRNRRLTPQEAAKYRRIREQIEQEKPEINARIRAQIKMQDVFKVLRQTRERKGLSLTDMERRTGMNRSAISKLETGVRANYSIETIARYAHAVGKTIVVSLVDESVVAQR